MQKKDDVLSTPTPIRLSKTLIDRIEKYREKMRKGSPGMNVTRTDAIRVLIERGLAAVSR